MTSGAIASIASRILGDSHGFAYVLENADGTPLLTQSGDAIVLMRGMLYGTAEEMCAQMEYILQCVRPHRICAVIDATHASFRFPDATVRTLFRRVRALRVDIRRIIFAGMSRLVRVGFRSFAVPLLGAELRKKIDVVTSTRAAVEHLGLPWPLTVRDPSTWIRERALVDGVDITLVAPSYFDARYTTAANIALLDATKHPPDELSNAVFECDAKKCGSGGLFGTVQWRDKRIWVCVEDDERIIVYRDILRGEYSQPINPIGCEADGKKCVVKTRERSYTFCFLNDSVCAEFETILSDHK